MIFEGNLEQTRRALTRFYPHTVSVRSRMSRLHYSRWEDVWRELDAYAAEQYGDGALLTLTEKHYTKNVRGTQHLMPRKSRAKLDTTKPWARRGFQYGFKDVNEAFWFKVFAV